MYDYGVLYGPVRPLINTDIRPGTHKRVHHAQRNAVALPACERLELLETAWEGTLDDV